MLHRLDRVELDLQEESERDLLSFLNCRGVSVSTFYLPPLSSPSPFSLICQDYTQDHSNTAHQIHPAFIISISKYTIKAKRKSNLINRINF